MSTDNKFKYGNELDHKLPYIEKPRPLESEEKWKGYAEKKQSAQNATILKLFKHYKISALNPQRWKALALALAEDHVEAMQLKENAGRKTVWDGHKLFSLYALYQIAQHQSPELKQEDRFKKLPELAKGTQIEDLINQSSIKNLLGYYHKRNHNPEFRAMITLKEALIKEYGEKDDLAFFKKWLDTPFD